MVPALIIGVSVVLVSSQKDNYVRGFSTNSAVDEQSSPSDVPVVDAAIALRTPRTLTTDGAGAERQIAARGLGWRGEAHPHPLLPLGDQIEARALRLDLPPVGRDHLDLDLTSPQRRERELGGALRTLPREGTGHDAVERPHRRIGYHV